MQLEAHFIQGGGRPTETSLSAGGWLYVYGDGTFDFFSRPPDKTYIKLYKPKCIKRFSIPYAAGEGLDGAY
jgi:hypothetical protein